MTSKKSGRKVLILGAAGRDYHNFNMFFKDNSDYKVVGFTHTQLPIKTKSYPKQLAGRLYKKDIPIYDESQLERIISRKNVDLVCFSYSDVAHEKVMHLASRSLAYGASFMLLGPKDVMLKSKKPVIAVCAVRTGAGKSPVTEYISKFLKRKGLKVGIIRHPMPYGANLVKQNVQVFRKLADLDKNNCTIEEREDYERHIKNGFVVYAGIDYKKILKIAEKENDVIIWDGGNNDFPFIKPNVMITIADAMRAGHECLYFPGEVNFRMADIILINKWEHALKGTKIIKENVKRMNPHAKIFKVSMSKKSSASIKGRVLVIEDGPTITHGGMPYGIGYLTASKHRCRIINARKYAVGVYKQVYKKYKHIKKVVPAIGYTWRQVSDLKQIIKQSNPDMVVSGTPTDLTKLLRLKIPIVRINYELKRNAALERVLWKLMN